MGDRPTGPHRFLPATEAEHRPPAQERRFRDEGASCGVSRMGALEARRALDRLLVLTEAEGSWPLFVELANVRAALSTGAERTSLLRRIGVVSQDELRRDDAIRYFEALARHQHFGRAAEVCAVSQPALSMQIRDLEHAYSKDGGLCVLYGNIAEDGWIVKTAGVDMSMFDAEQLRYTTSVPTSTLRGFVGPARIFESQDAAVEAILGDRIKEGDVVIIRYEGPKGGPGMQEMLYPTSYLKSKGLGQACALVTDGRFSGGTSGLSIGHCSPEAAEGGTIGLVEEGDIIEIDIPNRSIRVVLDDAVLAERRAAMQARGDKAWQPVDRQREVSQALRAYAALTTSAARGAVRDLSQLDG